MLSQEELYNYAIKKLDIDKYASDRTWLANSVVYNSSSKKITFIAGKHITSTYSPFAKFLNRALKDISPDLILLEWPKDKNFDHMVKTLNDKQPDRLTELDIGMKYALQNSIAVKGMDSEVKETLLPFTKDGIDKITAGILQQVGRRYKNSPTLLNLTNKDQYEFALAGIVVDILGTNEVFAPVIDVIEDLRKKYKDGTFFEFIDKICVNAVYEYTGTKDILELLEKRDAFIPYPWSKKYELNKIFAWESSYRDLCMIRNCASALKEYDNIVAIAGSAHIIRIKDFLLNEIKFSYPDVIMESL